MEAIEAEAEAVEGQTMESLPEQLLNPIPIVGIVYKRDTYKRPAPSKSSKIKGKRKGRQPETAEPERKQTQLKRKSKIYLALSRK